MALKAAGATLVSSTENIDETPEGELMGTMLSGMATFYSKNLGREVKKGIQQKVLMGRAFAAGARVLILDQPTAGVDVGSKVELYERIRMVTADGVAVIVISDDLDELLLLAHRILILHDGRPVGLLPAASIDRETLLAIITTGVLEGAA